MKRNDHWCINPGLVFLSGITPRLAFCEPLKSPEKIDQQECPKNLTTSLLLSLPPYPVSLPLTPASQPLWATCSNFLCLWLCFLEFQLPTVSKRKGECRTGRDFQKVRETELEREKERIPSYLVLQHIVRRILLLLTVINFKLRHNPSKKRGSLCISTDHSSLLSKRWEADRTTPLLALLLGHPHRSPQRLLD